MNDRVIPDLGALDALTDALAGSDQPAPQTIEQGVRMLGEHIGGGSSFGSWIEVGCSVDSYVSAFATETDVQNEKYIASCTIKNGSVFIIAGGLICQISFDNTPSGTPTAIIGEEPFTDFTYEDGVITFTAPDGGDANPTLYFEFA